MKHLILIFFLGFSTTIYSQTNLKLDQKNGFKTYKFGDLKSKYKNNLVENTWEHAYIFEYKPTEFNSIFNWVFEKMFLGFYNDKLGLITFYWNDNEVLYKDIVTKLETIYGKSMSIDEFNGNTDPAGGELISYNEWDGKVVKMTLRRYKDFSIDECENCKITLIIQNKVMEKQKLESEF